MEKIIEFIKNEWSTISSAPFTFIILFVLASSLAYLASTWRYQGIIDLLREQLSEQKGRMEIKNEQLVEYRERLRLIPSDATQFTKLTNKELQAKSLKLVQELRTFLSEREKRQREILFSGWRQNYKNLTEEQRQKAWNEETKTSMIDSLQTNADYDAKFKVDAILLRDELLSRLPKGSKNEREYRTYEHPTNPIGMGMVADDLERMAKLLPLNVG